MLIHRQEPNHRLRVNAVLHCGTRFIPFHWKEWSMHRVQVIISKVRRNPKASSRHLKSPNTLASNFEAFQQRAVGSFSRYLLQFTILLCKERCGFISHYLQLSQSALGFTLGLIWHFSIQLFYGLVTIFRLCYTTKRVCGKTKAALFFLNSSVHERLCFPTWRSVLLWISLISALGRSLHWPAPWLQMKVLFELRMDILRWLLPGQCHQAWRFDGFQLSTVSVSTCHLWFWENHSRIAAFSPANGRNIFAIRSLLQNQRIHNIAPTYTDPHPQSRHLFSLYPLFFSVLILKLIM